MKKLLMLITVIFGVSLFFSLSVSAEESPDLGEQLHERLHLSSGDENNSSVGTFNIKPELRGINSGGGSFRGGGGNATKPKPNLPTQGTVDGGVRGAPLVNAGKQGNHVQGHVNNIPSKSQWPVGENGVKLTQEAWMKGTTVKFDGSVKTYNFGRVVGPRGETRVKVHINKEGQIHGYPVH
ncbi:hypothetical protein ACERII_02045 [Evansella sp. AB-rgal1]|uniref:hypothetical protein n=1 Tax=Evansella sp. AB-rgal1 TaxID=3242696 RepID=UPI00359D9E53